MRKDIPAVILSLFICLFFCQFALAGETDWQIKWQEDGSLQEQVNMTNQPLHNIDASWQQKSTGNGLSLSRNIGSWDEYNRLADKLPLQAEVKDYLCVKIIKLTAMTAVPANTLYSSSEPGAAINIEMNVPAIILDSSASVDGKDKVLRMTKSPGENFGPAFILRVIMIDGFGLGIAILSLGVIFLAIFFVARMRKVNRIIDETYSLDNIIIEDDEDVEENPDTSDGGKNENNKDNPS